MSSDSNMGITSLRSIIRGILKIRSLDEIYYQHNDEVIDNVHFALVSFKPML